MDVFGQGIDVLWLHRVEGVCRDDSTEFTELRLNLVLEVESSFGSDRLRLELLHELAELLASGIKEVIQGRWRGRGFGQLGGQWGGSEGCQEVGEEGRVVHGGVLLLRVRVQSQSRETPPLFKPPHRESNGTRQFPLPDLCAAPIGNKHSLRKELRFSDSVRDGGLDHAQSLPGERTTENHTRSGSKGKNWRVHPAAKPVCPEGVD